MVRGHHQKKIYTSAFLTDIARMFYTYLPTPKRQQCNGQIVSSSLQIGYKRHILDISTE